MRLGPFETSYHSVKCVFLCFCCLTQSFPSPLATLLFSLHRNCYKHFSCCNVLRDILILTMPLLPWAMSCITMGRVSLQDISLMMQVYSEFNAKSAVCMWPMSVTLPRNLSVITNHYALLSQALCNDYFTSQKNTLNLSSLLHCKCNESELAQTFFFPPPLGLKCFKSRQSHSAILDALPSFFPHACSPCCSQRKLRYTSDCAFFCT